MLREIIFLVQSSSFHFWGRLGWGLVNLKYAKKSKNVVLPLQDLTLPSPKRRGYKVRA